MSYKILKIILFIIVIILALFQLFFLRYEYSFVQPTNIEWHIHHDEKLLIPDARFLYLKDSGIAAITDYKPCLWMSFFGVAGPAIIKSGFDIFGMNNVGLRFFFVIISCITTILYIICVLKIAPGKTGLFFSLLYIFSYNNFVLQRHAILENFLSLFLIGMLCLYITNQKYLLNNFFKFCFFSGITLLFKSTFALYLYSFLFIIFILENRIKDIGRFIFWSIAGILFFELVQLAILSYMGLAKFRYDMLLSHILQHSGFHVKTMGINLPPFLPIGLGIFKEFTKEIVGFYIAPLLEYSCYFSLFGYVGCLFIFTLIFIILFRSRMSIPNSIYASSIFLIAYLTGSSFFYFYPKRGVAFYPMTLVIFAYLFNEFSKRTFQSHKFYRTLRIFLAAFILINSSFRYVFLQNKALAEQNITVEKNSASINSILPKGTVIYSHCYGYRFLWMAKDLRFISRDDVFMGNSSILNLAVKNHAKYILFSKRGEPAPADNHVAFNRITSYFDTEVESDVPDEYTLAEIIPLNGGNR